MATAVWQLKVLWDKSSSKGKAGMILGALLGISVSIWLFLSAVHWMFGKPPTKPTPDLSASAKTTELVETPVPVPALTARTTAPVGIPPSVSQSIGIGDITVNVTVPAGAQAPARTVARKQQPDTTKGKADEKKSARPLATLVAGTAVRGTEAAKSGTDSNVRYTGETCERDNGPDKPKTTGFTGWHPDGSHTVCYKF